ncbi:hypothetical protein KDL45_10565, partial [bacterium]|nr:hypothetical protein [bacterium]
MLNVTAWLPFVAMALLVGAVLLCMRYLIPSKEAAEAFFNETLDTHRRNKWEQLAREKLILRYLQPILLLLGTSFRNWSAPDYRPQVTRKLVAAGFPLALNFETYCGLIVLSAAGGLLLGIYISLG